MMVMMIKMMTIMMMMMMIIVDILMLDLASFVGDPLSVIPDILRL